MRAPGGDASACSSGAGRLAEVLATAQRHPEASQRELARLAGVGDSTVRRMVVSCGRTVPRGSETPTDVAAKASSNGCQAAATQMVLVPDQGRWSCPGTVDA